jgi:hypothetical protein
MTTEAYGTDISVLSYGSSPEPDSPQAYCSQLRAFRRAILCLASPKSQAKMDRILKAEQAKSSSSMEIRTGATLRVFRTGLSRRGFGRQDFRTSQGAFAETDAKAGA